MERGFDRDTYLNKEKYNAAVAEENRQRNELISQRVEDMQKDREYNERQWRYFRNFIKMEIKTALAKNSGMNDEGIELMNGLADDFFDKFLVSAGIRNAPGVTDESRAITALKSEGLI